MSDYTDIFREEGGLLNSAGWKQATCGHPNLIRDVEGDGICPDCNGYVREPDLEADVLRACGHLLNPPQRSV